MNSSLVNMNSISLKRSINWDVPINWGDSWRELPVWWPPSVYLMILKPCQMTQTLTVSPRQQWPTSRRPPQNNCNKKDKKISNKCIHNQPSTINNNNNNQQPQQRQPLHLQAPFRKGTMSPPQWALPIPGHLSKIVSSAPATDRWHSRTMPPLLDGNLN